MPAADVDPATAYERLQSEPGAIYLDVRTQAEYDAGHPEGAWNIPLLFRSPTGMTPNPEFQAIARAALPRDVTILVGCKSGQRSRMACQALEEMGFDKLLHVAGGYSGITDPFGRVVKPGWADSGLPTTCVPTPQRAWDDLRSGETFY